MSTQNDRDPVLERAIKVAGSIAELARHAGGYTRQAVSMWKRIPAEAVPGIERRTGIPRHELRSDLWDAPTNKEAAE